MCPSDRTLTTSVVESGFRSAFEVLDVDRDGKISQDDLQAFYTGFLSSDCDESTIGSMMKVADSNENGFVEYEEFEKVLNGRGSSGGGGGCVMEEVFKVMDKDGDGKLSHEDLKSYTEWAGFSASDEDIKDMIALGGGDDKEGVSYQGLLKILAIDSLE